MCQYFKGQKFCYQTASGIFIAIVQGLKTIWVGTRRPPGRLQRWCTVAIVAIQRTQIWRFLELVHRKKSTPRCLSPSRTSLTKHNTQATLGGSLLSHYTGPFFAVARDHSRARPRCSFEVEGFRAVLFCRYESAMEWVATTRQADRLKVFWSVRYRVNRASMRWYDMV